MSNLVKNNILGVKVTNADKKSILKYIFASLEKKEAPYYIVTPNPEMVMLAQHDYHFQATLNQAEISLCDGIGLYLAARILGKPLQERITGVDLLENICKESVRKPVSIGFLGGRDGVAERAAECLQEKYPGLNISFIQEEWNGDERGVRLVGDRNGKVLSSSPRNVLQPDIDILFVAFGFPKQEMWMAENIGKLPFRVAMGVGGAFDYLSGNIARAPKLLQVVGMEWLYRLIRQPWRIKRQRVLLSFLSLVIKKRVTNSP